MATAQTSDRTQAEPPPERSERQAGAETDTVPLAASIWRPGMNESMSGRTQTDTSSPFLPRYAEASRALPGEPAAGTDPRQFMSAELRERGADRAEGGAPRADATDQSNPVASALVQAAQKAYQDDASCYLPRRGSTYSRAEVPPTLGCASCMSNTFADAYKALGLPFDYGRMHEVGVERWVQKYNAAGMIERATGEPQSGDFVIARANRGHPHMGVLSRENGVMFVYHNENGHVQRNVYEQSRFMGFPSLQYYRPTVPAQLRRSQTS